MKIPVTLVDVAPNYTFGSLPVPPAPHFATGRKLVGNTALGFGQYSVQINGSVWVNELYVRERIPEGSTEGDDEGLPEDVDE